MYNPYFNLPEISFVGGEYNPYRFNLKNTEGGEFDAGGETELYFSVRRYDDRGGDPLFTEPMAILSEGDGIYDIAEVILAPNRTVNLHGVFVYQISLRHTVPDTGEVRIRIPGQGILKIKQNINPGFIT